MYIHDYWDNPAKYDIYSDKVVFDITGQTQWEEGSGKWLSGPDSFTYQNETGVAFTKSEIGSQRYQDFINNQLFGTTNPPSGSENKWRYVFCVPKGYSTSSDLHPQLRLHPEGGPDWSRVSARPMRLNNAIKNSGFDIFGFEGDQGPNGGININTWNAGWSSAIPVSNRHVLITGHFLRTQGEGPAGDFVLYSMKYFYFLKPDGTLYKKEFKFVSSFLDTFEQRENFDKVRSFDDCMLLELEDDQWSFSEIGVRITDNWAKIRRDEFGAPFFSNYDKKQVPIITMDSQGKGNIFTHSPGLGTEEGGGPDQQWADVNTEEAMNYPLSTYAKVFEGDSGSPSWAYSESHGYVFMGGNNGLNSKEWGSSDLGEDSFVAMEKFIKTGIRIRNDDDENFSTPETHSVPLTPISTYSIFPAIGTPSDLKLDVQIYDIEDNFIPKLNNVEYEAKVTDSEGNEAKTNSKKTKKELSYFYDHSEYGEENQFPNPGKTELYADENINFEEKELDIGYDNLIYDSFYLKLEYFLKFFDSTNVEIFPTHRYTAKIEYKEIDSDVWAEIGNSRNAYSRLPADDPGGRLSNVFTFNTGSLNFLGVSPESQLRSKVLIKGPESNEEITIPIGTLQDFREAQNIRFDFNSEELYPGNTFIMTVVWDEPEGGVNPAPVLSAIGSGSFSVLQETPELFEFEVLNETEISVSISETASIGTTYVLAVLAQPFYGPYSDASFIFDLPVVPPPPPPSIEFTDLSTDQDASVTVGDFLVLQAVLQDYVGGDIEAVISLDGIPVQTETLTNVSELDDDEYTLSYTVTQGDIDENVSWTYSITATTEFGSTNQTRSGIVNQSPRIIVNENTTADGEVVNENQDVILDLGLINLDANGTATAEIKVFDESLGEYITKAETTLTGNDQNLLLSYTINNEEILADTTWVSSATLTNDFGTASVSFEGNVNVPDVALPVVSINSATPDGEIEATDLIFMEADVQGYGTNPDPNWEVSSYILIDGVDSGAVGGYPYGDDDEVGGTYRIEYNLVGDITEESSWICGISASNITGTTERIRSGTIIPAEEEDEDDVPAGTTDTFNVIQEPIFGGFPPYNYITNNTGVFEEGLELPHYLLTRYQCESIGGWQDITSNIWNLVFLGPTPAQDFMDTGKTIKLTSYDSNGDPYKIIVAENLGIQSEFQPNIVQIDIGGFIGDVLYESLLDPNTYTPFKVEVTLPTEEG